VEQLSEILGALEVTLTHEELDSLNQISRWNEAE
jgi:aryl-alcohol dehydrogenase-like predicted oxidoreductase